MEADGEKSALAAIGGYNLMNVTSDHVKSGKAAGWIKEWRALPRERDGHWNRGGCRV